MRFLEASVASSKSGSCDTYCKFYNYPFGVDDLGGYIQAKIDLDGGTILVSVVDRDR